MTASSPPPRVLCIETLQILTGLPAAAITHEKRVVEDLGLDSLALIELIVAIGDVPGLEPLAKQMLEGTWVNITVSDLIAACERASTHAAISQAIDASDAPAFGA